MTTSAIEETIQQAKRLASPIEQSMFLMNEGRQLASQQKIEDAEACFTQALEIQKKNNDIPGAGSSLFMLGQIWASYEDFESALLVLKEAYQIFDRLGAQRELLEAHEVIAQVEMAALSKQMGPEKMQDLVNAAEKGDRDTIKELISNEDLQKH